MNKILIIQTSFLGDVILATSLIESLKAEFPEAEIHFMLRKGNESLLANHPKLKKVWIWDKKNGKYASLLKLSKAIRNEKFDALINPHRFGSSGFIAWRSKANKISGFKSNPFSFCYTNKAFHSMNGPHEIERNFELIKPFVKLDQPIKPRLYPSKNDFEKIAKYQADSFVCLAPTSVWFTKQWPKQKWIELMDLIPNKTSIYLLGAPNDAQTCDEIIHESTHKNAINLCGRLSLLQSAALMSKAEMNYVNDSGPMHLASSQNAPVAAIFCSTVPKFGFGPLSDKSFVIETEEHLDCRPCGLHGHKVCPKGHFKCGETITAQHVFSTTH